MKYLTSTEIANIWNISSRRVSCLCSEGRIRGAIKKGKTWLIPETTLKPEDKRFTYPTANRFSEMYVSDSAINTSLSIDPNLAFKASKIFEDQGLSLQEAVNLFLFNTINEQQGKRIGLAEGKIKYCEDFDFCNDEIMKMFGL